MKKVSSTVEENRLRVQAELDAQKSQAERNRLGQFATPTELATDLLTYARELLPRNASIRFLDPALGTGSFYSALRRAFRPSQISNALGFEIDSHYAKPAQVLWRGEPLTIKTADFTEAEVVRDRFDLVVCNPPYVRHHHLRSDDKVRLQEQTEKSCGVRIGGLAGLYCYFMGLSHRWLAPNAISLWLVPSEFMDVNYGQALKKYLLEKVTLLRIHRFDPSDVQFADALVSSAIVCFRNEKPAKGHRVAFTFGGTLHAPTLTKEVSVVALAREAKWTRFPTMGVRSHNHGNPVVADFFKIKRGIATGDNGFFILSEQEIAARQLPLELFKPILPSPRHLANDRVDADEHGIPRLEPRLFLLDANLPESEIAVRYPTLAAYLAEGRAKGLHERYLCRHRNLWYAQENRPPAPIVCTYLGRSDKKNGRPFRFILNRSNATIANVYLAMYPTPMLVRTIKNDPQIIHRLWQRLNELDPAHLLGEGRVYGGGLHKLEPKELANVQLPDFASLIQEEDRPIRQSLLFDEEREAS